ncbi:MAG: ABC transporter substrate-binding protein [Anaerolineales bacterium]|nr:ABC transporter substrate-binding protein [Anaerolineales bacterium]MBP6208246.1 ABC transporter substrate-binding protein [Anaerolineales bacterium]
MFKKLVLIMLGLAVSLSACGGSQVKSEAVPLTKIRLPMGYIANIQYAPFYAAVEKGYFKDAGLEVEFDYSFETDGVKLVGLGELPFAVVSGEQVLLARAQDVPVTYVAAWYQQFPISVISMSEQGVVSPQDLKGKTIGLPGLFGANYIGLRALLFSAGLSEADVTLQEIGFNQVELVAAGEQNIVVGYAANEPIQLKAQGFEVTELRVADSVQLAANGILASEKVIAEDPELVRGFVEAFLKGLKFTIENPDEAYALSATYIPNFADLDEKVQKEILNTSIQMWSADRLGYSDPKAWENMQNILLEMGLITDSLDLGKSFTNEFVP